jgi:TnpA family transposase
LWHTLNFIDDETRRRSILRQLNLGDGRHSLSRNVFHRKRGELYQRYREGQEDRLSALGLVVNIIVLWNTLYRDAVLVNMLGRYSFAVPDAATGGELRPLRIATES